MATLAAAESPPPGGWDRGRALAGLAAAIALAGVLAIRLPTVAALEESFSLPILFRLRGPLPAPRAVMVVGIDRKASEILGLPTEPQRWPRETHAVLLESLRQSGAATVAFDLFFRESADGDLAFADAIKRSGNVLLAMRLRGEQVATGDTRARRLTLLPPIPLLARAAVGAAPFPLPVVPLRVSHWWRAVPEAGDLPTMPVLAAELWAQRTGTTLPGGNKGPAPLRELLNFYGPPGTVTTLSYADLVTRDGAGRLVARTRDLAGRLVLVGYTEREPSEQKDTFYFAYSSGDGRNLPGVEVAATAAANLLDGTPLRASPLAATVALMVLFGAAAGGLARVLPMRHAGPAVLLLTASWTLLALQQFTDEHRVLPLVVPLLLQAPGALLGALLLSYRESRRERERIARAMGRYLPADAVARLARTGTGELAGSTVFSVCLASDAAGFSRLAESLPPDALRERMNGYYARLFAEVESRGGIVSDIVGDAMLALWPARGSDAKLRRQACDAALAIVGGAARPGAAADSNALPTRVGLDCGPVALGDVGAGAHFEFRAVGDIVNTSTRIEQLNKHLGTTVLATAATVAGLAGINQRPLGRFLLPGKSTPVAVCELRPAGGDAASRATDADFAAALARLAAGDLVAARAGFAALADKDGPGRFYVAVCDRVLAGEGEILAGAAVRVAPA